MDHQGKTHKSVFYIPAGVNFIEALTDAVLSGTLPAGLTKAPGQLDLPDWTILLPTRRASRSLLQAFADANGQSARLLPVVQPLGDADEEELAFELFSQNLNIEPMLSAIGSLDRKFLLVRLINSWAQENPDKPMAKLLLHADVHSFQLAESLASFVDVFETYGSSLDRIDELFDGEFAEHRERLLDFLSIIRTSLPVELTSLGKLNPVDHRNRQMTAYTELLKSRKSNAPVIAAGSTGSVPATADMLATIAAMENGAVVLPGLDVNLDDESWQSLPENHPQFGMRELLNRLEISRDDVQLLPGIDKKSVVARNWLVSEIMRPAETTDQWRKVVADNPKRLKQALNGVSLLQAEDQRSQAVEISLIMRQALESDKSVALITPDRDLARNVKNEMSRWNVVVDDSAGEPLAKSAPAVFARLILHAAHENFLPISIKALLSHAYAGFGIDNKDLPQRVSRFEQAVLRANTRYKGLTELEQFCGDQQELIRNDEHAHPGVKAFDDHDWQDIADLAERLVAVLSPLDDLFSSSKSRPLSLVVNTHLRVCEAACGEQDGTPFLWLGDAGEKLASLFGQLVQSSPSGPEVTLHGYLALLESLLGQEVVRPKQVTHSQISIYGLMEARLISADVVILGGLNEKTWPPVADGDPWLTRPQLRMAGLPVPERRVGLTAHDFAQGFCAKEVYLTSTKKINNLPAVSSRWILRLQALLKAARLDHLLQPSSETPWAKWALMLDAPSRFSPSLRPRPSPASTLRPHHYSVTSIAQLIKNPYEIFARKILSIVPMTSISKQVGAAERGNLVHAGLQRFIDENPGPLGDDAVEKLMAQFELALDEIRPGAGEQAIWKPQLKRMAEWFVSKEKEFRNQLVESHTEIKGKYDFVVNSETFVLTAKADRIDVLDDGTLRIIDYKTGGVPSLDQTAKSFSPQLWLEAGIAASGGFSDFDAKPTSQLNFVKLSGGIPAGKINNSPKEIANNVSDVMAGMAELVSAFCLDTQPYIANANPEREGSEREFDYLSRWREWAHLETGRPDDE